MVPFHILFYGFPVDNFEYIIITALNESIFYHDLFNFTVKSVYWADYKYTIDGLTNRTPQGSIEYQFSASTACARLYNYLNSSKARYIATIGDVPHSPPHIYTSNDIMWISFAVIIAVVLIAFIVWLIRLPHKKMNHYRRRVEQVAAISIVNYECTRV